MRGKRRHLVVEGFPEGRARLAAQPVRFELRYLRDEVRVTQDAQHRGHEQIGGGEAALQVVPAVEPVAQAGEARLHRIDGRRPAQLRPLLVRIEEVDGRRWCGSCLQDVS